MFTKWLSHISVLLPVFMCSKLILSCDTHNEIKFEKITEICTSNANDHIIEPVKEMSNSVDNCLDSFAVTGTQPEDTQNLALIPYNPDNVVLSIFHEKERVLEFVGDKLRIKQDWDQLGVAAVVWDAAIVLSEYLEQNQIPLLGKDVIEIGAGSGLVGMVAALLGGHVAITDREAAIPYLESVVHENLSGKSGIVAEVKQLDWETDVEKYTQKYDVILGADVIYIQDIFPALLKTLLHLSDMKSVIYLSCKIRYDRDTNFLKMMETNFSVEEIYYDKDRDIKIFKARRKNSVEM